MLMLPFMIFCRRQTLKKGLCRSFGHDALHLGLEVPCDDLVVGVLVGVEHNDRAQCVLKRSRVDRIPPHVLALPNDMNVGCLVVTRVLTSVVSNSSTHGVF